MNLVTNQSPVFARDIVVGLFRLAGIEEDEDLLTACISDVRWNFLVFPI